MGGMNCDNDWDNDWFGMGKRGNIILSFVWVESLHGSFAPTILPFLSSAYPLFCSILLCMLDQLWHPIISYNNAALNSPNPSWQSHHFSSKQQQPHQDSRFLRPLFPHPLPETLILTLMQERNQSLCSYPPQVAAQVDLSLELSLEGPCHSIALLLAAGTETWRLQMLPNNQQQR